MILVKLKRLTKNINDFFLYLAAELMINKFFRNFIRWL